MTVLRELIRRCVSQKSSEALLELQYQTIVGFAGTTIPVEALKKPDLVAARTAFRQIEVIEGELSSDADMEIALRLLGPFLSGHDPWLQARAAKAIHRMDPQRSLNVLQHLVEDPSPHNQLPGVWALGELATTHALDLLMRLAWSPYPSIQQAVIRRLILLENKNEIPAPSHQKVKRLLQELRSKTDWII